MSSVKDSFTRQSISSGEKHERYARHMEYPASDIYGMRASPATGQSPWQVDAAVTLIIPDDIRRYSIEGMLRSLDMQSAVLTVKHDNDFSPLRDGRLIITSGNALGAMPDECADELRVHNTPLLILVDPADVIEQSWADRAKGFVDWADLRPETLREAIADVRAGRFHVSASLVRRSVTAPHHHGDDSPSKRASMVALTAREHQVLRLIAEGQSNRQVARSLSISEHGVKRTVGILLAKLNCPNRTLAVVRAIEAGLLLM
ncbi:response regulator transcription factor [Streptomyces sp. NPDC015131]|uniref:helix-turn-helix transcriptional regulator n=1 Tax=Streptomyces sp. NPDC015131 TaxID=3364941 RepID=UPI0036FE4EEC